ncbi:HEPN domain-containing protein [Novosphingobium terrae]|uniref:HEPN domain-containing protein n=1 Tax=Novosphingobium terrae TaxID=2726189 RepID=UPI001F12D4C1|nr:HEPN domain-containing protein [Novosphingobium terrae]
MRNDIGHLPTVQQDELDRTKQILMSEFAKSIDGGSQPWRKSGRVLKIILFGSYARTDWVDEPENGYQSDFDLLIIVSHPKLTDIADYWYIAEDKILRDEAIGRPVNIIVHTLEEVNQGLVRGEYFWVDIARDGVVLYDLPGNALLPPKPATAADAYEMAGKYFRKKLAATNRLLKLASVAMAEQDDDPDWLLNAAFNLHQAAETAYACFLLVRTLYFPRSHNIKFLRSIAEDNDPRLIEVWPRTERIDRRRFELLKRAYVEARYVDSYEICLDDVEALAKTVHDLRDIVELVSKERLEILRKDAGL